MPTRESLHTSAARELDLAHRCAAENTYGRLRRLIPEAEWLLFEPLIADVERLKSERNAIILAHNYDVPVR